jgi:predicted RNA-binding Zn ribbon-like protein
VREAIRALGLANNGGSADLGAAAGVLDAQARRSKLAVRFGPGAWAQPDAAGVDGALGRLLGAVAAAMADGRWARIKACDAETCRWLFYDRAPNSSRRWCSMKICGNREKARAYRARHGH